MGVGSDFTKGAQYSRNEMITARNQVSREIQPGPRRVENNRLDISNQEFRFKWSRKRRSLGSLKDSGSAICIQGWCTLASPRVEDTTQGFVNVRRPRSSG